MTPLRSRLRERTRAAHDRVDAAFGRHDLATRAGYAGFLRAHAAAFLPVEAALDRAGAGAVVADWPARRRAAALRRDLSGLGVPVPAGPMMPDLAGPAEVLGALYVVEGSRLGARVLLRAVEAGGDEAACAATAYLGHGAGLPLWPSFVAQLEASPYAAADPDRVVAGALLAFDLFDRAAHSIWEEAL